MPKQRKERWPILGLGTLIEGGLGALALFLGWLLGQSPLATFSWNAGDLGWGLLASLPMLALFLACIRWPWGPLGPIKRFSEELIGPLFASCSWLELAYLSLLAGAGEELLFRGYLQAWLVQWTGPTNAWLLASLLFGLFHPITAGYVLLAAGMGLYLGWVWMASGNLLTVIVAHAFYDWVALVYLTWKFGARPNPLLPTSDPDEDLPPVQPQADQPQDQQDSQ